MSDKIKRLRNLPGSKTGKKKDPELTSFAKLVTDLQNIALSQQKSQSDTTAAIQNLSKIVMAATKDGFDVERIIIAINELKEKMVAKEAIRMPLDYTIDFERDKFGLMKTGIELNSVTKRLN